MLQVRALPPELQAMALAPTQHSSKHRVGSAYRLLAKILWKLQLCNHEATYPAKHVATYTATHLHLAKTYSCYLFS